METKTLALILNCRHGTEQRAEVGVDGSGRYTTMVRVDVEKLQFFMPRLFLIIFIMKDCCSIIPRCVQLQ